MTRITLFSSLLLVGAACTSGAADPAVVVGALSEACIDGLRSAPDLEQRLVAFDGKVIAIEVWFEAAPGTKDNCVEVRSITLGGKGPIEALPFRLGPVAGGGRAEARFHFEGVEWRELAVGNEGDPVSYEAVYANELTSSHAMAHAKASGTSDSRLSFGMMVGPDDPGYALLASHLAKDR